MRFDAIWRDVNLIVQYRVLYVSSATGFVPRCQAVHIVREQVILSGCHEHELFGADFAPEILTRTHTFTFTFVLYSYARSSARRGQGGGCRTRVPEAARALHRPLPHARRLRRAHARHLLG